MRIRLSLVLFAMIVVCGCNELSQITNTEVEEPTEVSCADLLGEVEHCVESGLATHGSLRQSKESFRIKILRERVSEGLEKVDELLSHEDATDEEIEIARCLKADLLFLGAVDLEPEYKQQLSDFTEQMVAAGKDSAPCRKALSRTIAVELEKPKASKVSGQAVMRFANAYPDSEEATDLLNQLANKLMEQSQLREASALISRGEKIVSDPSKLASAHEALNKKMKSSRKSHEKKREASRFRDKVKRKAGFKEHGYFVVFSVAKTGRKFCDYSVCSGLDDLVRYVKGVEEKDWKWEIKHTYPDTDEGRIEAHNKKKKLKARNTIQTFSYR